MKRSAACPRTHCANVGIASQFGCVNPGSINGDGTKLKSLRMQVPGTKRELITFPAVVLSMFITATGAAQEGYHGVGHDDWHRGFYSNLKRNDGGGSCCNLMDCRPTQSRMVGDHYEVKVDGEWVPVPKDKINNVVAPDGGAHVCAPRQVGPNKGVLFCVILPSEG